MSKNRFQKCDEITHFPPYPKFLPLKGPFKNFLLYRLHFFARSPSEETF